MPAYVATYTKEQRAALCRAVLVDGLSVRAALDAAKAGELPDISPEDAKDLQTLSYVYACQIVREHRAELDGVQRARSAPGTVSKEAATFILRRAQTDAKKIANGSGKLMDAGAALQTLRVIEAAQRVIRNLEPKKPAAKPEASEPAKPKSLAAQIAASGDTVASDLTPEQTPDEVSALADTSEDNDTMDGANGGAARPNLAVSGLSGAAALAGA